MHVLVAEWLTSTGVSDQKAQGENTNVFYGQVSSSAPTLLPHSIRYMDESWRSVGGAMNTRRQVSTRLATIISVNNEEITDFFKRGKRFLDISIFHCHAHCYSWFRFLSLYQTSAVDITVAFVPSVIPFKTFQNRTGTSSYPMAPKSYWHLLPW